MTIQQAYELAVQHHQSGRLAEAEALYRQILASEPRHAPALHLLGVLAHQHGRHELAAEWIGQAIALAPEVADFHSNLGEVRRAKGRWEEAIAAYRRALALNPQLADALNNLGNALREAGQLDEAIGACRQAIALQPDFAQAYCNLGNALEHQRRGAEAIAAWQHALALNPRLAEAHCNLASAWWKAGQPEPALAAWREAIALKPNFAEAHLNLAAALGQEGRLDEAIACCHRALAVRPDFPETHSNLGNALKDGGQLDEAIAAYRRALELRPCFPEAHSNLVLTLHYHPRVEAATIAEEHRRWNARNAKPLRPHVQPHTNDRTPDRRLKIGYVSPDFRAHSVASFFENVLTSHDAARVEVFCYSALDRPDAVTARLRQHAAHWRSIAELTDAEAAELIRRDGIDVLVDLAGHTSRNRLLVFALQPAPVQVSWLGYPGTTGLAAIGYRLTDALADPPGTTEHFHTEQLVRLPDCAWCFRPDPDAPPVAAPPLARAGHVTFGCFNAQPKLNAPLFALWAKILRAVPGSRLLLKNRAVQNPSTQQRLLAAFAAAGLAPERIELAAPPRAADHLAAYGRVDLALDTFPYHGVTTTCEALWMGVPVISLAGKVHAARVGVSLLTSVGLAELIAAHEDDYVRLAAQLAGDPARLAALRSGLRARLTASPLLNAPAFARHIEAAYREMWRKWSQA